MALVFMTGSASGQTLHRRWELTIHGTDTVEAGDLRFNGATGRILLQHEDSAFQPLQQLRVEGGRISFALPRSRRTFEGVIADSMYGTVRNSDGTVVRWAAVRIPTITTHMPVPPRVVVRQLMMGSGATTERIPASWIAAALTRSDLERMYHSAAVGAGVWPLAGSERADRASLLSLGLVDDGRNAAVAVLESIAKGPADGPEFRAIFMRDGKWKIDIHDAMIYEAAHYQVGFRMSLVADGLKRLGEIGANADSDAVRQAAWRFWSTYASDTLTMHGRMEMLTRQDGTAAAAIRAMLAGYDDSMAWWRRAVSWLLMNRWLETPGGPRSPRQLMASFWGVDSLVLPGIRDQRFGEFSAFPTLSINHIASRLFRPANAIAAEWLPDSGTREVFESWRQLRWGESPLTVQFGLTSAIVGSPWSQATVRPGSFFGARDEVRMEPGIMPIAAVATFLHEWHHLLVAQRRLAGAHPAAILETPTELRLREDDAWLSEGFAEWATDRVLMTASNARFLLLTQAEKRLAIAEADPNDPHVLGYQLVADAARRLASPAALRDRLVAGSHDLPAFAAALGFGRSTKPDLILPRQPTAVVIPEVTFTWNEGSMFDWSRRLVIPNTRSEH